MEDQVIKKMRPDRATYWPNYAIAALILLSSLRFGPLGFVVGLILVIVTELVRLTESFYVTEGGVCREYKFLSKNRIFIDYRNIQNLTTKQSFIERMFGIGSVTIDTAGSDKEELTMYGIKNPGEVQHLIEGKMVAKKSMPQG